MIRPRSLWSTSFRRSRMCKNRSMPLISTVFSPYKKPRDSIAVAPMIKDELMRHGRLGRSRGVMAAAWVALSLALSCMAAIVLGAGDKQAGESSRQRTPGQSARAGNQARRKESCKSRSHIIGAARALTATRKGPGSKTRDKTWATVGENRSLVDFTIRNWAVVV